MSEFSPLMKLFNPASIFEKSIIPRIESELGTTEALQFKQLLKTMDATTMRRMISEIEAGTPISQLLGKLGVQTVQGMQQGVVGKVFRLFTKDLATKFENAMNTRIVFPGAIQIEKIGASGIPETITTRANVTYMDVLKVGGVDNFLAIESKGGKIVTPNLQATLEKNVENETKNFVQQIKAYRGSEKVKNMITAALWSAAGIGAYKYNAPMVQESYNATGDINNKANQTQQQGLPPELQNNSTNTNNLNSINNNNSSATPSILNTNDLYKGNLGLSQFSGKRIKKTLKADNQTTNNISYNNQLTDQQKQDIQQQTLNELDKGLNDIFLNYNLPSYEQFVSTVQQMKQKGEITQAKEYINTIMQQYEQFENMLNKFDQGGKHGI
jgi:hypothetical protein